MRNMLSYNMIPISVTQLARNLADVVNRVVYRGEEFIVLRGNRPVAELTPAPRGRRVSELPGVLAALPRLGADEADRFAADLATARGDADRLPGDPWAS